MLPDFPTIKRTLSELLGDFMHARVGYHWPPFQEIRHVRYFEGDTHSMTREDGETEKSPFRTMASEITFQMDELPKLPLQTVLERLDGVAADMARQHAEMFYQTISDAVEKVGNVVDAKGKRLTAQMILEMYEKLQIDFDRFGQPNLQQIHLPPGLEERAEQALRELSEDPGMRKQFENLIIQKKEEWRAREASRKLVG